MNMKKFMPLTLLIGGCSIQSPILDTEPNRHTVIVTKPPMRVIVTGNISDKEHQQVMDYINSLDRMTFKRYHFNDNVTIRVIDSKGDGENINLHYTTPDTNTEEYIDDNRT